VLKHVTLVFIALVAAAATAMLSQTADDMVQLSCALTPCSTSGENGVLLVAKTAKRVIQPTSKSAISVGTVDPAYGQVVAFRSDHAPAIQMPETWTPHPKTVTLDYPDLADVPLQIWVICADAACGPVTPEMRAALETFRSNANDLLTEERAGMRISQAGGPTGWISDETQNTALAVYHDFLRAQCSDLNTVVTMIGKKKTDAVNMYLVRTVDSAPSNGYRCPVQNLAVDGSSTYWTTKLHEVGHTMSLLDAKIGEKPDENVMYSMPSDPATRQYFSEGQIFRMHFDVDSSLNMVFGLRAPAVQRDCGRTNADAEAATPPCPPLTTWVWPEN
jgi:hypothetical protein